MEEDTKKCALCTNVRHIDHLEECPVCKRLVCYQCTVYTREYETGAEIIDRCSKCYHELVEAERNEPTWD